ncbi:uncharacterized protein LOC132194648 [Neocloeon triangulifer]|uniref:uncharacterized protein LOC132194648 n=1 Tax=Neocloeon triangulifer TaxID=2078957 RepID=UPI00286F56EB|nr:uncharacterized protein LOC132194648 [Neocloeon triangulifer]
MAEAEFTLSTISAKLTPEILQNAAQQIFRKKLKKDDMPQISRTKVSPASAKGDGFLGIIYRIVVTLTDGTELRLIGKGLPANLVRREAFKCNEWFAREVHFYSVVCPALRSLGGAYLSVADCYYAMSDGMNDFLLLEDLLESGFQMADKKAGLNTIQTISIFKMMARYHALSLSLKVLQPEKFKEITKDIKEGVYNENGDDWIGNYMENLGQLIERAVQPELGDTHYLERFKKFSERKHMFALMQEYVAADELRVVNHGDSWAANFMFDKTGAIAKAIDFQITRHSSLMMDVSTVIFACTTDEHRNNLGGVKGILRIYHDEVLKVFEALNVDFPEDFSMERLLKLWPKLGAFGLSLSIELVPVSMQDQDEVKDLDDTGEKEASTLEDMTHFEEITKPEQVKRLVDMIKLAVDDGVI